MTAETENTQPENENQPAEAAAEATETAAEAVEQPAAKATAAAPAAESLPGYKLIEAIEQEYLKKDLPALNPGDTVKIMVRIREGNKERLQGFEGVIIKESGRGISKTITVRRVFQGVGVERVFLLHSPRLDSIKVLRRGYVRRAKLYYLRERTGKAARIREKTGSAK